MTEAESKRLKQGRRRVGGRAAMRALRAAPIPLEQRPVRPGLPGGRYKPLSQAEMERVHQAALEVLETIGLSEAIPSCIELVTAAGGSYTEQGRLLFPRSLVEDTIANAARNFVLHAQDSQHDMDLSASKVHYGTAGAAVHMVDWETREYRDSTLADLYDIARLVDAMDNIHFFQRSIVARDMTHSP